MGDFPSTNDVASPVDNVVQPSSERTNGMAITGFVLGLLSFVIPLLWIFGIIFSIIGMKRTANGVQKGRGLAIAGLVLSILTGLASIAVVTIIWAAIIPMINDQLDEGMECLDAVSLMALESACKDSSGIHLELKRGAGTDSNSFMLLVDGMSIGERDFEESILISSSEVDINSVENVGIAPITSSGVECDISSTLSISDC